MPSVKEIEKVIKEKFYSNIDCYGIKLILDLLENYCKSLKLSVGNEVEKIIMIEQRLLELENYLNFVLNHKELSSSQILEIFLSESKDLFGKQFLVLEQAIDRAE